jgi:DedD protein
VKERLTGAAILLALIVLLVPELLTGPVRSAPRTSTATPAAGEEPPLRSYTINLADDARARTASRSAPVEAPAPAPAVPASAPVAAAPEAGTALAPPAALPATPLDTAQAPPATRSHEPASAHGAVPDGGGSAGGWMVQLGSFANRDNAERLAKQLRAGGFQAGVSQGTSGRHLYRVRAGPAHDRAGAEQLAEKLRAAGHSGAVVPK